MTPKKEEWLKALELRHGKALQEKFSASSVAVCGLGGLGSNIAIFLARAGIGKLILIDFDEVDTANLNRQQYKACQVGMPKTDAMADNLREIAPYSEFLTHNVKVTEKNAKSLLRGADIICEAFDKAENKAMLANIVLDEMPDKYLVAASGMAGIGSPNTVLTRRVSDRFYLCGDGVSDVSDSGTLFAPRVALCASHQALTVLRILAEQFKP